MHMAYASLTSAGFGFLSSEAVSIRKHLDKNRKDKDAKFRLILVESRIHRLARSRLLGFCAFFVFLFKGLHLGVFLFASFCFASFGGQMWGRYYKRPDLRSVTRSPLRMWN